MPFISEQELKGKGGISLAPMIDFLFLMLVFFASLAISRITTRDTEIDLVKIKNESHSPSWNRSQEPISDIKIVNITITKDNEYKWVTDIRDYKIDSAQEIKEELIRQYERGLLPEDIQQTQVLLKIDKEAKWDPILQLIFAIRDAGFEVHPIYQPEDEEMPLTGHVKRVAQEQLAPVLMNQGNIQ